METKTLIMESLPNVSKMAVVYQEHKLSRKFSIMDRHKFCHLSNQVFYSGCPKERTKNIDGELKTEKYTIIIVIKLHAFKNTALQGICEPRTICGTKILSKEIALVQPPQGKLVNYYIQNN